MARKAKTLWIVVIGALIVAPLAFLGTQRWLQQRHVEALVGTYDYSVVFDNPDTHARLTDFLGKVLFTMFRTNMETVMPIQKQDSFLVLKGLQARKGGEEEALLWIEYPPAGERIIGLYMHNRYIRVYLPEGMTAEQLPTPFVESLHRMNFNDYPVEYMPGDRRRESDPMPDDHMH